MALENRYDFIMLFDVENGNPNGDPDAGNMPRVDVESGYGFITDVCLKRKIRNYVELVKEGEAGYNILVKHPYALYRAEGYVSAALANKSTGLSEDDLELLWSAIINMFENDHSAARGKMCMRKLYIFKHSNVLGNCPSHLLFDKIAVSEKEGILPRSFTDYEIKVDRQMPEGVELIEKI